ncbi:flagellar protein FlgN [Clostridium sp.]|uniref:flagellar protein FlgN n=1 Tax=Clostridium sp. TaxID=1506 RepID=UPI003D6C88C2
MKNKLNTVMIQEIEAVTTLLSALEEQHRCIIKSDIFGMENCVDTIKKANTNIAAMEVSRRKITENRAMSEIVEEFRDVEIEKNYYKIKAILQEVKVQKDTNELLIKQGLSFTSRILNILNPVREKATYNSRGKINK